MMTINAKHRKIIFYSAAVVYVLTPAVMIGFMPKHDCMNNYDACVHFLRGGCAVHFITESAQTLGILWFIMCYSGFYALKFGREFIYGIFLCCAVGIMWWLTTTKLVSEVVPILMMVGVVAYYLMYKFNPDNIQKK